MNDPRTVTLELEEWIEIGRLILATQIMRHKNRDMHNKILESITVQVGATAHDSTTATIDTPAPERGQIPSSSGHGGSDPVPKSTGDPRATGLDT